MEQLTKKERTIMDILWNANSALSASEIKDTSPDLNINTVQQVLRNLLKCKFIEVDDIVFNKKSLTRTYKPLVSQAQYISAFISDSNRFKLLCGLVDEEDDLDSLNELQKLIDKRKKEIRWIIWHLFCQHYYPH